MGRPAQVYLALMPPMLRCARPAAPAPCAAAGLLGLASIEGWRADLAPVLTELLAAHCGYFVLRRLVLARLKVREGPSADSGADKGCLLPVCFRTCEQPATICT